MDVPLIVSPSFKRLSALKAAMDVVNRVQKSFRLLVIEENWIPDDVLEKRGISDKQMFKEMKSRYANTPMIALVQSPFMDGAFTLYKHNFYIISAAGWEEKYAPPTLKVYVVWMIACGLCTLAGRLSEKESRSMEHKETIGCIYDYCGDRDSIKLSLPNTHTCEKCQKKFLKHGVLSEEIDATEQILKYVRDEAEKSRISCFISHNHRDKDFAERLQKRLQDEGIKVYYAPKDLKGGQKSYKQIVTAIEKHEKLIIVLSENSLGSKWVKTEISKAIKLENDKGLSKLFPIRLVDFAKIRDWELFDSDQGTDLAKEVREYHILDFSNWKDDSAFELSFDSLLLGLRSKDSEVNPD